MGFLELAELCENHRKKTEGLRTDVVDLEKTRQVWQDQIDEMQDQELRDKWNEVLSVIDESLERARLAWSIVQHGP